MWTWSVPVQLKQLGDEEVPSERLAAPATRGKGTLDHEIVVAGLEPFPHDKQVPCSRPGIRRTFTSFFQAYESHHECHTRFSLGLQRSI